MESVMANQIEEKQWYLAVGERSLGPLSTELVARGISSGKVPASAWICQVGDTTWSHLSSVDEFHAPLNAALGTAEPAIPERISGEQDAPVGQTVAESGGADAPTAPEEDEEDETGKHSLLPYEREEPDAAGEGEYARTEQGSYSDVSGQREIDPALRLGAELPGDVPQDDGVLTSLSLTEGGGATSFISEAAPTGASTEDAQADVDDLSIDITFGEEDLDAIDWRERFQSYYLVGSEVVLPQEDKLLQSLSETPKSTFLHDEALWNLSLCLAFGSDSVAQASAATLFQALQPDSCQEVAPERVEWVCRTLLSKGFMPSGIPRIEGNRGVSLLRRYCPPELTEIIEREAMS